MMSPNSWRERRASLDLTPEVAAFVDALIDENERLRAALETPRASTPSAEARRDSVALRAALLDTRRVADSLMLIAVSASGQAKRTPVNSYSRQRRGGVGNFDLRVRDDDPASFLAVADQADWLVLLTRSGRAYRIAVADIPQTEPSARGDDLLKLAGIPGDERLAAVHKLSEADIQRYILFGSQTGFIKRMRAHYFGAAFEAGRIVLDPRQTGGPASAMCLSGGTSDILMVTRQGMATRFNISVAPLQAAQGIKLKTGDALVGILPVVEDSAVALLTEDGLGTRRLMEEFTPNKSPGAGGKIIMKSEAVIGVAYAPDDAELLCLTRFGKVVRFSAEEIPAKTAPVQGVDCVNVRGDTVTAVVAIE